MEETNAPVQQEGNALQSATVLERISQPVPWQQAPVYRQFALLLLLSAAVAAGFALVLWTQEPDRVPIYSNLEYEDSAKIATALEDVGVDFSLDERTGAILVPKEKINVLRMRLSAMGLPENNRATKGLEILQEEQSLSTSQFVQQARYKSALETELGRSVASLRNVKSARVHLAMPKQSVFVRKRVKPSASVVVHLNSGRRLENEQVAAIVHMVSSSIPHLEPGMVTVVDQLGNLLTENEASPDLSLSTKELTYTRRIEEDYSRRVMRLLEPIVGFGRVRAQVTAELDFTQEESTTEQYDPNGKVVRSEQLSEQRNQTLGAIGIPGALSNQPPGAGTTDEESAAGESKGNAPRSESNNTTRNYELDRTISHVRRPYGLIKRLSVAVLIDDKTVIETVSPSVASPANPDSAQNAADNTESESETAESAQTLNKTRREPYSDAEIDRITRLVKETIGFKEARGDSVLVVNSAFITPEVETIPELEIWEQPWFQGLVKQVLAGLFVLLLLLMVVRPIVRYLIPPASEKEENDDDEEDDDEEGEKSGEKTARLIQGAEAQTGPSRLIKGTYGKPPQVIGEPKQLIYEDKLEYSRMLMEEDPERSANLLKKWMAE